MLNHTKRTLCFNTKKTIGSAAIILMSLAVQNTNAVSMKGLNLLSNLGEPFRAEIELSDITTEELNALKVNIAAPENYRKEGLEYSSAIRAIKASLVSKAGKQTKIILSSTQSTDEPILDILVELQTGKGTVLKKFTALLDSPVLQTTLSDIPNLTSLSSSITVSSISSGLILKPSLKLDSIQSTPLNNKKPTFVQINQAINSSTQLPSLPINKLPNKVTIEPLNSVKVTQKKALNQTVNNSNSVIKPKKNSNNSNNKDTLIVATTPEKDLEKITKKTPQEIASILVKSGVNDQEQITKIIQVIAGTPQKNDSSSIKTQNNPVISSADKPQIVDTPTNIIVPPLPVIDESSTKKTMPIKPNTALDDVIKPEYGTNLPWYDTLFGKISLFSALLIFLGLLGFSIQRFFQFNRRKHPEKTANQNKFNNQSYSNEKNSLKNTIFSNFYKEKNQILSESTEFPSSQINIADSILDIPTDISLSQINVADSIIENETIKSFNKNGGKKDKNDTHLTLSDSTTLISKVVQKNNNIPAIIKKPTLMTNTKLIIVPNKLTNENARKQYRLLKNSVDTKPTDLTPKIIFIKFLHKNELLDEANIELESLKMITKQQGPQWAEVASIYDSYQKKENMDSHQLKTINLQLPSQDSALNFPLNNDSTTGSLNLDLGNLTVLMSPPSTDIVAPKNTDLNFSTDFTTQIGTQSNESYSNNNVQSVNTESLNFIKTPIEFNLSVDNSSKNTIPMQVNSSPNTLFIKNIEEKIPVNFKSQNLNPLAKVLTVKNKSTTNK